jgi:hypothetical protein
MPLCALAAGGYNVVVPSGGPSDSANINAALAGVQPVLLTLDGANPTRTFSITRSIQIPAGKVLVCESTHNAAGSEDGVILQSASGLVGPIVHMNGTDALVRHCNADGNGNGNTNDCFVSDTANYVTFDDIGAFRCSHGLNLTPNAVNMVNPHLIGHSMFYQNVNQAIYVGWDVGGGSTSDLYFEGANVGTNCINGCDGDVYIYGANGQVNNFRTEWSWNSGFFLDKTGYLAMSGNLFDRTGGASITIRGPSYVLVSGGSIQGANRNGSYVGPAVIMEKDEFSRLPTVEMVGTSVGQWASGASYWRADDCISRGLFTVAYNGVQPTAYGVYADTATHTCLKDYVLAPPAFPQ